jgi:hypothetical protein
VSFWEAAGVLGALILLGAALIVVTARYASRGEDD